MEARYPDATIIDTLHPDLANHATGGCLVGSTGTIVPCYA